MSQIERWISGPYSHTIRNYDWCFGIKGFDGSSIPTLKQMQSIAEYYKLQYKCNASRAEIFQILRKNNVQLAFCCDHTDNAELRGAIVHHMEMPIEEPTEATIEEPTEATVEEPTEATIEEPTKAIIEEPTEATIEEPMETTIEAPIEGQFSSESSDDGNQFNNPNFSSLNQSFVSESSDEGNRSNISVCYDDETDQLTSINASETLYEFCPSDIDVMMEEEVGMEERFCL